MKQGNHIDKPFTHITFYIIILSYVILGPKSKNSFVVLKIFIYFYQINHDNWPYFSDTVVWTWAYIGFIVAIIIANEKKWNKLKFILKYGAHNK